MIYNILLFFLVYFHTGTNLIENVYIKQLYIKTPVYIALIDLKKKIPDVWEKK